MESFHISSPKNSSEESEVEESNVLQKEVLASEKMPSEVHEEVVYQPDDILETLHTEDALPITGVVRVVGKRTEEEKEALLALHRSNIAVYHREKEPSEREKTQNEIIMIARAEKNINGLRARYGLPAVTLPVERVKMIDQRVLSQQGTVENVGPLGGGVDVIQQKGLIAETPETVARFDTIQHELFHLGSYQALQYHDENNTLYTYRVGLAVASRRPNDAAEYPHSLSPLNEAVTEENARRMALAISEDDPGLGMFTKRRKETYEEMKQLHAKHPVVPDPDTLSGGFLDCDFNKEKGELRYAASPYPAEREAMWHLFDKVYEKNPNAFPGKSPEEAREEMFEMATKAAFTGNLFPLGRLVNKTFGNGTFQKYGRLQTAQEIETWISTL